MNYLDFEIAVTRSAEGRYQTAIRSPVGTVRSEIEFDPSDPQLGPILVPAPTQNRTADSRSILPPAPAAPPAATVESAGRRLFERLLSGEARTSFRRSLDRARDGRQGLRIRLRIDAPEIANLPWEFLFDDLEDDFLCLSPETSIVRHLEIARPVSALAAEPPFRLLAMIGGHHGLDVEKEKRQVTAALEHLVELGFVKVHWVPGHTWRDLQQALEADEWHLFHFIGHGGFDEEHGEGVIQFEAEAEFESANGHQLLSATQLGRLLHSHRSLRMVVLNSCEGARASSSDLFSSTGATLVRRGLPAVISMQYEVSDRAAIEFARTFYDVLVRGKPVDGAVAAARTAISMSLGQTSEWATPVLHMRSEDGRIFRDGPVDVTDLPQPETPEPPSPTTRTSNVAARGPGPALPRGLDRLAEKVRHAWIDGVLEESVFGAGRLQLGLAVQRGAVDNPWGEDEVPAEAENAGAGGIAKAFEDAGRTVLLIGEPGSGKTTTLLQLTRELLASPDDRSTGPIPVVFQLASWNSRRDRSDDPAEALAGWMVDQLAIKYQVPKRVARSWVDSRHLLPLFDGLDEVSEPFRAPCAEAINHWVDEERSPGLVVCCHLREYSELPVRLRVNRALRMEPFERHDVIRLVGEAGEPLAALHHVLTIDPSVLIQACNPLMLSLMIDAYQGLTVEQLQSEGIETAAARRQHLMDAYVAHMFATRGGGSA